MDSYKANWHNILNEKHVSNQIGVLDRSKLLNAFFKAVLMPVSDWLFELKQS